MPAEPSINEPMTDEQIRSMTIGELKPHAAPVDLVEYDMRWPRLFRREDRRIRQALGERVRLLEHVGSTSVPGLAAKPIIDILLIVPDSGDEQAYVHDLESVGYVLRIREPHWHEHRVFKGPDTNVNLHVHSPSSPEIRRMLDFRDHLRRNEADRRLYENAKRRLARRKWKYIQNYADAKTDIIEEIIARAT